MRQSAAFGLSLLAAVVGISASALLAQESIVKTRDNGTYQGTVTETATNVTVKSHNGVETVIARADVLSINPIGTYAEEYKLKLSKLDPKDVSGRIALARDAFDHREYALARNTVEEALTIDPNSREATDMLGLIQTQIRLERSRQEAPATAPAQSKPTVVSGQAAIDRRLLTSADIEAIRRAELQPSDTSVRIRFESNDVKKRFADSQNVGYAEFTALQPVQQALLILDRGDDSMREKIHIMNDPQSITEYRRQIQPLVIQNCATSGCHGGPPGAGLVLLTNAENDPVTYTNFYILQSYKKRIESNATGIFAGNFKRMIMRGQGEQSLLANYGLPANIGEYDHPPVNGKPITPIFRNKADSRYLMVVDWMNNSLKNLEPVYGIHYTPPSAMLPSAPASQPAGTAP